MARMIFVVALLAAVAVPNTEVNLQQCTLKGNGICKIVFYFIGLVLCWERIDVLHYGTVDYEDLSIS